MATLTAGAAGIDFDDLVVSDLLLGDVTVATATQFTLRDGPWLEEFGGQFTYANDAITGGTLTSWKESLSGQMVFEVKGFSVPVTQFVTWATTNNNEAAKSAILAGGDSILGSGVDDRMRGYAGNDTLEGGGGQDYLRGDDGADSLSGGAAFDDLNGNAGADTAAGGLGDDWVVGGKDNDLLFGDDGADIVYGNLGADTCHGGAGADLVRGGQENDSLSGGDGNDWLSGDRGDDTISGGLGADIFNTFGEAGIDRVMDFNLAEGDRVRIDPGFTYATAQVGADVVITLSGGAQMTLVGVQLSSLGSAWIFTG
ncbi:MAG: calcium-binding protein [Pseudomonadota bacterium]